jgi:hypothetical protein
MSDLTAVEKRKLEKFLGMSSGWVLDFSDRSFAEFVQDSTGRNIFDSRYEYKSNSKANRLRAFWQKEDNATVGKLIKDLLDISEDAGPTKEVCRLIVSRLLNGAQQPTSSPVTESSQPSQVRRHSHALAELREEFSRLAVESDRNKAGLALEQLLNRLFALFELKPRQPFRVVGEQIDGSFELDNQTYLLESKWEKQALSEAPLLVFRGKIEGKSTFTRGVLIALNDITAQARDAITRGKAPSFFVMNGHDLMMILSEAISLTDFLRKRVRLLAEEGRMCVPFSELVGED